ncbi:MAG: SAM-dependent methyltransferase [Acidimicrobiia bacterium]|nr:SAM-dependent methyltransferase [Acidimicrobiia bacterium]
MCEDATGQGVTFAEVTTSPLWRGYDALDEAIEAANASNVLLGVCGSIEEHPHSLAVVDRDATLGLGDFSHVEVLFLFHLVDVDRVCTGARHPRGREDWPLTGILAQRARDRPNRLGSTVCAILDVGPRFVDVSGLDAVVGTPVLDVKPYMTGFGPCGLVTEPRWATDLMDGYW